MGGEKASGDVAVAANDPGGLEGISIMKLPSPGP
jgi:hypothetical protein